MTISTLTRTKQYNGNNSTTVFAYDFNIQADSELEVYLGTPVGAPTSWTKQTLTTHYTVSGAGVAGGGNVTFGSAPPTGTGNVFIRRVTAKTQASDYVENDPFTAATLENNLDKLTQIQQDMQEEIDRCFKLGSIVPDAGVTEASSVVADRKNMLFAFDDDGDFSVTQEIGTSQGNWAASTAYVVRDIVKDTGASPQAIYICLTAHTSSGSLPISTNTDAAKWRLLVEDGAVGATGTGNIVEDTSPQLGGFLDANGNYIQMQKGGDISSASPTVVDTDGDYFIVTGTTNFSALTVAADRHFFLEFAGALTITHGSGTIDLPGGANITTVAGDVAEFVSTASNVVTCVNYTRASGKAVVGSTAGISTIWIPALAMVSPTTNGAEAAAVETTATKPEMKVLDFHQSTVEYAQFSVAMPKSWNEGTVTAKFYWTHATAVATDVVWGIQGVCVSDNDTIDATFGTGVTVTDTFHNAAEDLAISDATAAITLGGSPAEDDLAYFQVYRNSSHADDTTNSTDARLIGVKILFTTNAENDS